MFQFTRHDEDGMWVVADNLVKNKQFEEAKTLIKFISEKAFTGVSLSEDIESTFSSISPSSQPIDDHLIKRMQQLNEQLRELTERHENNKAKFILIDYVDTLSEALDYNEKNELRKKLLASLIDLPSKEDSKRYETFRGSEEIAIPFVAQLAETYSPKEAAEILGVSDQTIRRMCEKGKFPEATQTAGGHWKIPKHYFKVTLEDARARKQAMKEIDERTIRETGDSIDEFNLF